MSPRAATWVNWAALLLMALFSGAISFIPVAALTRRPWVAVWATVALVLLAAIYGRHLTRTLQLVEYAFEWLHFTSLAALGALFWMLLYGGFYGLLYGPVAALRWLEWWSPSAEVLAFWVALPIAILILFAMIAGDWDKSRPRMALPADGGYPVYPRPQTTDRGAVAAMVVLSALIILACWFLWRRGLPIAVLSGVFIVFVQFVQRDRSGVDQNSAVAAVAKLFQVCGYRVDLHPQVGDPELDALLEPMDLFAAGGTGSFAVSVCTTQRGRQSVHWKLAASVRAAGTLYAGKDEVQALLLLVGVPLKNDLRAFARGEGIRVIPLPDGAIIYRVMRTEDPDELRQIAEIYLQIEPQRVEAQA